jgi:pantetheine-phosphate adenylyltransferase
MKPIQPGKALFPASFDPVTNGHLDLIHRGRQIFPDLVVAVATNVGKSGTFSIEDRLDMMQTALGELPGVTVTAFDGLVVDFASQIGAGVILRGLRANADFEYEFEMALMNRHMKPEIQTLFLMTSQEYFYVRSSRLKELTPLGTAVSEWVPPVGAKYLREKLGNPPQPGG